jgi:hypothetical protein
MAEVMTADEFRKRHAKKRATGGKRARDNGNEAESLILGLCDEYRAQGRANLKKVDPPSKVVYKGGKPTIIYQANPFLDLVGPWTEKGGRACFLEVKSTAGQRLPIARPNGVTVKQLEALREWRESAAVTGVLWVHANDLKVITLETIEFAEGCGHASIPWRDFPLCRRGASPLLRFDFLAELADA